MKFFEIFESLERTQIQKSFTMKMDKKSEDDFKVKLLTQEIKFAKMLAGNELNAATKEKHIKKLSNWLRNRAACSQGKRVIPCRSL